MLIKSSSRSLFLATAATLPTFVFAGQAASSSSISQAAHAHAHATSASNAARTSIAPVPSTSTSSAAAAPAATSPSSGTVDRTTEQGEAQILDPNQECSYYSYPPVTEIIDSYPDIWVTADLSNSGISEYDRNLFETLNKTIPNIAPRGTRAGDMTGVVYDTNADPDCWWTDSRCTTPKLQGLEPDVTLCNEPNTWGFTLDDGPNCSHNAYFDYLQSIQQKASLFYIGSNVLDWPLEAQRGLADGHEICAHTWSHPYMTSLTNEQAFAELYYSKKAIKDVLGITVRCWRPPYGDVDDRIRFIAKYLDMETIIWTDDTFDYDWVTLGMDAVRKNYDAILARQAAGEFNEKGIIVLTHEIDAGTMQLSQEYLPQMIKQFTGGVVPVGTCMNNTRPYVNQDDYIYPNYAQYMAGTKSISLAAPTANPSNGAELVFTASSAATTSSASASASGGASRLAQSQGASTSTSNKASETSKPSSAQQVVAGGGFVSFVGIVVGSLFLL